MKRHLTFLVPRLIGAAVLASLVPPGVPQQGEVERIKTEIRSTLEQLHAVRAQRQSYLESSELETNELGLQVDRLETDLEEARVYVEDGRAKVGDLQSKIGLARAFSSRTDAFLDELSRRASEVLAARRPRVEAGVSWAREPRLAQLDRLSGALATRGEERERALLEFWAFLSEELRLSHTLDERNELIALENGPTSIHAYVLRLGLLQELFIAEDGSLAGMHVPAEGWKPAPDPLASGSIDSLLKVARGKAAASLAPTLFSADRVRGGE